MMPLIPWNTEKYNDGTPPNVLDILKICLELLENPFSTPNDLEKVISNYVYRRKALDPLIRAGIVKMINRKKQCFLCIDYDGIESNNLSKIYSLDQILHLDLNWFSYELFQEICNYEHLLNLYSSYFGNTETKHEYPRVGYSLGDLVFLKMMFIWHRYNKVLKLQREKAEKNGKIKNPDVIEKVYWQLIYFSLFCEIAVDFVRKYRELQSDEFMPVWMDFDARQLFKNLPRHLATQKPPTNKEEYYNIWIAFLDNKFEYIDNYYTILTKNRKHFLQDRLECAESIAKTSVNKTAKKKEISKKQVRNILEPLLDKSRLPFLKLGPSEINKLKELERGLPLIDQVNDEKVRAVLKLFRRNMRKKSNVTILGS